MHRVRIKIGRKVPARFLKNNIETIDYCVNHERDTHCLAQDCWRRDAKAHPLDAATGDENTRSRFLSVCGAAYPRNGGCNFWFAGGSISQKMPFAMKCEELLELLNEYVDGTVDPGVCEEFEIHMAGCNPCRVVVDNIRKTITLYKAGEPYALPVEFRDRLHRALREKWKERHPSGRPDS